MLSLSGAVASQIAGAPGPLEIISATVTINVKYFSASKEPGDQSTFQRIGFKGFRHNAAGSDLSAVHPKGFRQRNLKGFHRMAQVLNFIHINF